MEEDQKLPELKNLAILKKMGGPAYYSFVWQKVDPDGMRVNLNQRDLNHLHKGVEPDCKDILKFGKVKVPRVAGQFIKICRNEAKKNVVSPKKKKRKKKHSSEEEEKEKEESDSN